MWCHVTHSHLTVTEVTEKDASLYFFCHLQNVNCETQLQPPKNTCRVHETFSKPKIKALQRTSFSVFSEKSANSSIDGAYLSNWSPDFES